MDIIETRRIYFHKVLMIGIPVVLQNLISISLNLLDTIMIGRLGENEVAAVGAANQVYCVFTVTMFGLFSGAAVFTAQYWGAKNLDGVHKMVGIDYFVGALLAVLVSLASYIFAPYIINVFSSSPKVIEIGARYLRIVCISYLFGTISMAISYNCRAVQNLKFPTFISFIAFFMNASLNYILIFGKLGLPALGVEGAAIATLIARVFEFTVLLAYLIFDKAHPLHASIGNLFSFDKALFFRVMRTALPVVATEGSWAMSFALILAAYGKLGTSALAVAQVANVIASVLQSLYFGLGNSTAVIIGEGLGQRNKEKAQYFGRLSLLTTIVFNIVITAFLILISSRIASIYAFNAETMDLLIKTIIVEAILITPKMTAYMFIVGILRAGGDTVFCMKIEIFCNLLISLPLAYISVMAFHVSLPVALIFVDLGDVIRILVCYPRYKSRKWINILT